MTVIMEECGFKAVSTRDINNSDSVRKIKNSGIPFLRQLLVCSGVWNAYFTTGLGLGAPTVLIPQLRREANSTAAVSEEMASWIASISGYAGLPWVLILPVLVARIGRKYTFFFVSVLSLISYISFYCCNTAKHILICEILQGPLFAAAITITVIIITEYTSPKHRGMFLTLKSASLNWGMWVSNALGTFFHWKTIIVLGIICTLYNTITVFLWPESPFWLASKHRFEECAKAHRQLKGDDVEAENELNALIKSYTETPAVHKRSKKNILSKTCNNFSLKAFYKPLLLCVASLTLYHSSGKLVVSIYAIDIIKQITNTESTAYMGMLLLDGVTVFGMYIGCYMSKILKRRTLLLLGSVVGITFLFIISLHCYLVYTSVLSENKYVSLSILTMFSLSISFGPIIMSTSVYGELIPLRFRTSSMFLLGMWSLAVMATSLKLGPLVFRTFKLHGAFLFYGLLSSVITYFLYKFLPETKDKTLQEIENVLVGRKKAEPLMSSK